MAIFIVKNTKDKGSGSLREAIIKANKRIGKDTIIFSPHLINSTINLKNVGLTITDSVKIIGLPGLTVNGSDLEQDPDSDKDNIFTIKNPIKNTIQKSLDVHINFLTVANAPANGLSIVGDHNYVTAIGSNFKGNKDGFEIDGSDNIVKVIYSKFNNKDDGLEIDGDRNIVKVIGSKFFDHEEVGIEFDGDDNNVILTNVTISENDGGGILFDTSPEDNEVSERNTLKVFSSTIKNNGGVGIEFDGDDNNVILTNVTVSKNDGGGILFDANPDAGKIEVSERNTLKVFSSTIKNNGSIVGGVGISGDNNDILLQGNIIMGNTADDGGGIYITGDNILNAEFNRIQDNTADSGDGGGLAINGAAPTVNLLGNNITNNMPFDIALIDGGMFNNQGINIIGSIVRV